MTKLVIRDCDYCGTKTHNKRFCSKKCSAKVTNRESPKKQRKTPVVAIECHGCGATTTNAKYCSRECSITDIVARAQAPSKARIAAWLEGKDNGDRLDGHIKRYLRIVRGDKCEQCGWCAVHSLTGKVPVELDHVDGNWQNNSIENVRLLCPNCHSLTDTYRSLNRYSLRATAGREVVQTRWDAGRRLPPPDKAPLV